MNLILKIVELLPTIDFIEAMLVKTPMALMISRDFYKIIANVQQNDQLDSMFVDNTYIMVAAMKDHLWEVINTGHFSKVDKIHRQLFTLAALQKTLLLLLRENKSTNFDEIVVEKCIWELDNGLLLGCALDHPKYKTVLNDSLNVLQSFLGQNKKDENISILLEEQTRNDAMSENGIEILATPPIQVFREKFFDKSVPVILRECMLQWPALVKWSTPDYLLGVASNRIVPIEIGKNYTNENWSQDLVKFQDFFRRQILSDDTTSVSANRIEYLAQHNLFEQIPALRDDILTPEYCCVTHEKDGAFEQDIKAWLGPEGTISPMHFDAKHNLLCQVFGHKQIILAAPDQSSNVYPFDGDMLANTAQIDAENLDFDRFPLARNAKFFEITLYKGEILYIPPKWWHYVRSLSKSFSVSFWWE